MTRCEPDRSASVAVIAAAIAFVPPALGGDDDLARERAEAFRGLVEQCLLDAEQRWLESSSTDASPRRAADVALSAFQDEATEEEPYSYKYQTSIDYNGDGVVDEGDLARAAQNPIADLISLPFQNNTNIDVGQLNNEQNVLNIQPVIPFSLNEDWNLITRTIIPVVYQPSFFPGDDHDFGLGDIQFSAFFSPTKTFGGWLLGGGPAIRAPTATDERLGARKWAIGPSAVVLRIEGPWVIGGLFQNVWSVAGSGDRHVNEFLVQPFVNYNIPDGNGWYLTTSPIITANWQAGSSSDRWTVPLGGGVGRVFRIGDQPVNCSLQGFYNVEKPDALGDWTIRFQFQLLFPR